MLGSCKLFYFQRLGQYSDHDPSLTKTLIAAPLNFLLLAGILYSLILISSYYHLCVLLVIGFSSVVHYFCLSAVYREKNQLTKIIDKLYDGKNEIGTKETNNIFWMSVFTSWVAPCTVWANNKDIKTRFLLSSSAITIVVNMLSIAVVYIRVSTIGLMDNVSPPVSHCYPTKDIFNASNYLFYEGYNSSHKLLNICGHGECLPMIQICSESQSLFENADFLCSLMGIMLLLISLFASAWLQGLESNSIDSLKNSEKQLPTKDETNLWSPMHKAVEEKRYGFWCFYNILGGINSTLNGHRKSTIQILSSFKYNSSELNKLNFFVRWWIKMSLLQHERNALHKAAEEGNTLLMEMIIENGYDIDEGNLRGKTALHIAAEEGHTECLKLLVESKANLEVQDFEKRTPLHISAHQGQLECLKCLVDKGADLKVKDNGKLTPLHLSAYNGHLECLKYLIDKGADLLAKNNEARLPLHLSAEGGHLECLKYLIDKGADFEAKDFRGQTALCSSGYLGHIECLKYLIDKGADFATKDIDGRTPLHYFAFRGGNLKCLKYLIDKGADLEAKDHAGRTPLHLSASAGWNLECITLLIEQKAEVNASDRQNNTPLHILRKKHNLEQNSCLSIAEELIKAGADLTAVNNKGKTPMDNEHVQQLREAKPELFQKMK